MNKIKVACILLFIPVAIPFIIMMSIGTVLILLGIILKWLGYNMWLMPGRGKREWDEVVRSVKLIKD